jgi:hypothetical protein
MDVMTPFRLKLNDAHVLAREIYEATEHIPMTPKPEDWAGKALKHQYTGFRAKKQAYKALHTRDRLTAAILVEQARQNYETYKEDE